jgi:(p)ppGpp synthase/HD superfamily hydrolase
MPNKPLTSKEEEAWNFAKEKHKGQIRRFIGSPYFDAHVQKVNGILKQYTTDEDILCASILHDVLEDCYDDQELGYQELENKFGWVVADTVRELTSDKNELINDYSSDKAAYLIDKMIGMSDEALTIKLADRLQNISDAFTASPRFRLKYFNETTKIIQEIEKFRNFDKVQQHLVDDIKSKLENIESIFKIKRFNELN